MKRGVKIFCFLFVLLAMPMFSHASAVVSYVEPEFVSPGNKVTIHGSGFGSLGYKDIYSEAIQYAYDNDVVIVAAAGNGDPEGAFIRGQNLDRMKSSPVCNESGINMILGVGATTWEKEPVAWSNYGAKYVDVSAPGEYIISTSVPYYTTDNEDISYASGTSFAAPLVAGVAALLKEKNPEWSNAQIIERIIEFSDKMSDDYNGKYGVFLNAEKILDLNSKDAEPPALPVSPEPSAPPVPGKALSKSSVIKEQAENKAVKKARLVKVNGYTKVFAVINNRKIHIPNEKVFRLANYKWKDVEIISQDEMDKILTSSLIKSPISNKVYVVKDGKKSWIPDEKAFLAGGYKWEDIVLISQPQVDAYEEI